MEVYYVNHKNQKIDLGRSPYQMQVGDIFNFTYKYEGSNNRITRIYKDISTISTTVTIDALTEKEFCDATNHFFDIVDVDNLAEIQGKLYIGDYYLSCNILASTKKMWKEMYGGVENDIKILTPCPTWYCEITKSFLKGNISTDTDETAEYLYYPFSYPYQYSMPSDVGFLQNDHYAPCDFKMIIYGPCVNPSILINGHLYEVTVTLYAGEYILIDSRENTVYRYKNDGSKENIFNWRNKESGLFEKIPSGSCSILWNTAAFGFDITLFQERSEPKWSL